MSAFVTTRKKINAGIDMTPLIDVVFQLLIFLMVSSHFVKPDHQVELPSGSGESSQISDIDDKHVLAITKDNTLILNGENIDRESFEAEFQRLISGTQITRLEVRGDKGSELGTFIDVLEKAKMLGADPISYHKKAADK